MIFSLALNIMFAGNERVLVLNFLEVKNVVFWAKKLMVLWYLLITEKILFWSFREWEIRSFSEPKRWWKDNGYWLIKVLVLKFSVLGKYGLFLSQEVDGKIIFTGCWEVLLLNFSVMGNTVFFSAKKLMKRWYLHGLFDISMIFQDLENVVFRAVWGLSPLNPSIPSLIPLDGLLLS